MCANFFAVMQTVHKIAGNEGERGLRVENLLPLPSVTAVL